MNSESMMRRACLTPVLCIAGICCGLAGFVPAQTPNRSTYSPGGYVPDSQPGWERFVTRPDPSAPEDEAQGGRTALGTPVARRLE